MKFDLNNIVEKKLGIPPNYQYRALHGSNYLQSNWHANKLEVLRFVVQNFQSGGVTLDLGPGSGNYEYSFADKFAQIVAVDYHKEALDFMSATLKSKRISNVSLIHSDIRDTKSYSHMGKFDFVTMVDVIEHIPMADAQTLIRNLHSLMNPGGKICIITPNYQSGWSIMEKILDKMTIVPHFDGQQHLAQYHPQNLRRLFEQNNFLTRLVGTFNTLSFLVPYRRLSERLAVTEIQTGFKYGNLLVGIFEYAGS